MGRKAKRRQRRLRGTGSICPDRRRGGYRGKLVVGRTPAGKAVYAYFRGATAQAVQEAMANRAPPAPTITVAEWSKRWLASLDVREQSRDNYGVNLRLRIVPALGLVPVARLTTFQVDEAAKFWGARVGALTVRHTLATLSACLKAAVAAELISRNPAQHARKPRHDPAKPDPFTPAEVAQILAACLADPALYPIALCCACGTRIGEAAALRPGDYDPRAGVLTIARTANRGAKGRPRGVNAPKSRHGLRTIEVPPEATGALAAFAPRPPAYRTLDRRWQSLLDRLGLRHRGLHQLRHSFATHMLARGAPIADVARYLGDRPEQIVRTYTHPTGYSVAGTFSAMLEEVSAPKGRRKRTK